MSGSLGKGENRDKNQRIAFLDVTQFATVLNVKNKNQANNPKNKTPFWCVEGSGTTSVIKISRGLGPKPPGFESQLQNLVHCPEGSHLGHSGSVSLST